MCELRTVREVLIEDLHRVRAAATDFRIPEQKTLGLDVAVDEAADGRAECLLLVRAYDETGPLAYPV